MKTPNRKLYAAALVMAMILGLGIKSQGDEIYAGTLGWQSGMDANPESWQLVAQKAAGLNVNWASSGDKAHSPDNVARFLTGSSSG